MRSFARAAVAALVAALLVEAGPQSRLDDLLVEAGLQSRLYAQAQARTLYQEALERESQLRAEMEAYRPDAPTAPLLRRVRGLASAYDDMSRLFPASGYGDNALWQGAMLAADAFKRFGDADEHATATRLFGALTSRFPTSSLVRRVPAEMKQLASLKPRAPAAPAAAATKPPANAGAASRAPAYVASPDSEPAGRPAALPLATSSPVPAATTGSTPVRRSTSGTVALTAIRRELLPDALRITLELDREVPFHDERLGGPPRVFLDLQNTRAVNALQDAVIPIGDDVVRQVRVGRQLDSRTRVVLDLKEAARYSVYTLYNPYRVVIDFERQGPPPANDARTGSWNPSPVPAAPSLAASPIVAAKPVMVEPKVPVATAAPPPVPASANASGNFSLSRQLGLGAARIVVDAGHGGHDPGAKARGLSEADLTLDVALRLEKLLLKQPGFEVVLTRRGDTYVSLEERTAIANREGADLFLSIHANASANAAARGIETYFLNFATTSDAEAVAARENAGAAKNMRHLPEIVQAIALNNKIDESRDFASSVQTALLQALRKAKYEVKSLGVKQAPFMVLIGATMPSILAEISFITNRQEANLLKTEKYRQDVAEALFDGVIRYQQSLKKAPAVASKN
jgi:N-acetylmuramoyl-L-alanine amidase